ncbi:MAG: FAD-dependent monooxygenase, partial [Pyrinomonadaceae bacterium]
YDEIERRIKLDSEIDLEITHVNWFSTYKVHTRHVNKFVEGRCFVAGDAAHIHTPAGAQGMNTGIQDGYNLAWKLSQVLRGKADERLLETFDHERLENAANLTSTTDRFFNLVASPDPVLVFIRLYIFPYIAQALFSLRAVKRFVFPRISQIAINYRSSPLSVTDGSFRVKAGDRMPWFKTQGESIYDRLREPLFHHIVFTDGKQSIRPLPDDLNESWTGMIDSNVLDLTPEISGLFGTRNAFFLILRPDNYIGLISQNFSPDVVRRYLAKFNNK